uniref:Uncharacterized protein n=1 Tax=Zea mays TaxID=4577 RepID=C4J9J5_MAIZE|nr:unknown [Zea mays]
MQHKKTWELSSHLYSKDGCIQITSLQEDTHNIYDQKKNLSKPRSKKSYLGSPHCPNEVRISISGRAGRISRRCAWMNRGHRHGCAQCGGTPRAAAFPAAPGRPSWLHTRQRAPRQPPARRPPCRRRAGSGLRRSPRRASAWTSRANGSP